VPAQVLALEHVEVAIATAADTGCPPNVMPCVNMLVPSMNGSAIFSDAITAPIGA